MLYVCVCALSNGLILSGVFLFFTILFSVTRLFSPLQPQKALSHSKNQTPYHSILMSAAHTHENTHAHYYYIHKDIKMTHTDIIFIFTFQAFMARRANALFSSCK